jgi:hypothetical protein
LADHQSLLNHELWILPVATIAVMAKPTNELSSKQRHFCRLVAAGTQSNAECYRQAYDATGTKKTSMEAASRLLANSKVKAMVDSIYAKKEAVLRDRALSHREIVIDRLLKAVDDDSFGVNRIKAIDLLATVSGMKKQSLDIKQENRSPDAITSALEAKLAALGLGEVMNTDNVIDHGDVVNHDVIDSETLENLPENIKH